MSKKRFWTAESAIIVGLIVLCTLIMALMMIRFSLDYAEALERFPQRHVEATSAIERTYAHLERFGRWPNQEELDAICRETLPSDWSCWADPDEGFATISLSGPHHFAIIYYFEPPHEEAISREWTFSNEGSKSTFQSSVAYSIVNTSETEDTPAATVDSL